MTEALCPLLHSFFFRGTLVCRILQRRTLHKCSYVEKGEDGLGNNDDDEWWQRPECLSSIGQRLSHEGFKLWWNGVLQWMTGEKRLQLRMKLQPAGIGWPGGTNMLPTNTSTMRLLQFWFFKKAQWWVQKWRGVEHEAVEHHKIHAMSLCNRRYFRCVGWCGFFSMLYLH